MAKVHLVKLLFPVFEVYFAVSSLRTKRLLPHIKVTYKNKGYKFIARNNVIIKGVLQYYASQLMTLETSFGRVKPSQQTGYLK